MVGGGFHRRRAQMPKVWNHEEEEARGSETRRSRQRGRRGSRVGKKKKEEDDLPAIILYPCNSSINSSTLASGFLGRLAKAAFSFLISSSCPAILRWDSCTSSCNYHLISDFYRKRREGLTAWVDLSYSSLGYRNRTGLSGRAYHQSPPSQCAHILPMIFGNIVWSQNPRFQFLQSLI